MKRIIAIAAMALSVNVMAATKPLGENDIVLTAPMCVEYSKNIESAFTQTEAGRSAEVVGSSFVNVALDNIDDEVKYVGAMLAAGTFVKIKNDLDTVDPAVIAALLKKGRTIPAMGSDFASEKCMSQVGKILEDMKVKKKPVTPKK